MILRMMRTRTGAMNMTHVSQHHRRLNVGLHPPAPGVQDADEAQRPAEVAHKAEVNLQRRQGGAVRQCQDVEVVVEVQRRRRIPQLV